MMTWTETLNDAVPRLHLGGVPVDVYEWARWSDPVANPPHRHTYFEVCRVEGGHGEFVVAGRRHRIAAGDLLYARPGVRHQILSPHPPGIALSWVAFDVAVNPGAASPRRCRDSAGACGCVDGSSGRHPVAGKPGGDTEAEALLRAFLRSETSVVRDDGRIGAVWRALRDVAAAPVAPGQRGQLTALGEALLLGLAQAGTPELETATAPAADRHTRAIRNAVRYVHDNLDRPLRVDELARHVHVSARQLTRLFTSNVGSSPASYVERVRLDRAAALLVRTGQPIKQIAADLGYPDVAAFTRAFSRRHGCPPGRFRTAGDLSTVLTAPVDAVLCPDLPKPRPVPPKTGEAALSRLKA